MLTSVGALVIIIKKTIHSIGYSLKGMAWIVLKKFLDLQGCCVIELLKDITLKYYLIDISENVEGI